jgi:hypothetical protein
MIECAVVLAVAALRLEIAHRIGERAKLVLVVITAL